MIFYWAGGFIGGTHRPYYVLTTSALSADTTHNFLQAPIALSSLTPSAPQPQAKYDLVKNLFATLPPEMLASTHISFGQSVCCDMAGLVIDARINGINYTWSFGQDLSGVSPAVLQFFHQASSIF
jgi:hypothetical protein